MLPSIGYKQRTELLVIWCPLRLVSKSASKLLNDTGPSTAEISTVLILPSWMKQNFYKATKKTDLIEKNKYHIGLVLYFCKNSTCMNNIVLHSIYKRKFCAIFTTNQTIQEIINVAKLMQLIFITQSRCVQRQREQKQKKRHGCQYCCCSPGLSPQSQLSTNDQQRKKENWSQLKESVILGKKCHTNRVEKHAAKTVHFRILIHRLLKQCQLLSTKGPRVITPSQFFSC